MTMTTDAGPLFFTDDIYKVTEIPKHDTHHLLLNVHYAGRIPAISHAYGLFKGSEFRGVVTYGMPPSPYLCRGVCGPDWSDKVLELNRLCLFDNEKNEASILVGASLKKLPRPTIVVSFADTGQNHTGFVYQATNFIYTGITAKRYVWAVHGLEHMHTKSICNMVKDRNDGQSGIDAVRQMFGERFYRQELTQKHRYIYFCGSKTERKAMLSALRYDIQPYPKPERNG